MKTWILSCALILWGSFLAANSVTLVNSSPFPLNATIYAADGTILGQYSLKPQDQKEWSNDNSLVNPTESQTPYTVIWTCATGGNYSVCSNVGPGAEVFSSSCAGPLVCPPKKQQPNASQPPSSGDNP